MTLRRRMLAATLAALFLAPAALRAADPTLDDVKLGKHVSGETWDLEGLKGRTVLIYFWDTG